MSKWLLAAAILLSAFSLYLAGQQIAEGRFPYSLTTVFLMTVVVLEQPAPKRTLGRLGAALRFGCLGAAIAIVVGQLA